MQLPDSTIARLGFGPSNTNNLLGMGLGGGVVPNLEFFINHQFVVVGINHTTYHLPLGELLLLSGSAKLILMILKNGCCKLGFLKHKLYCLRQGTSKRGEEQPFVSC